MFWQHLPSCFLSYQQRLFEIWLKWKGEQTAWDHQSLWWRKSAPSIQSDTNMSLMSFFFSDSHSLSRHVSFILILIIKHTFVPTENTQWRKIVISPPLKTDHLPTASKTSCKKIKAQSHHACYCYSVWLHMGRRNVTARMIIPSLFISLIPTHFNTRKKIRSSLPLFVTHRVKPSRKPIQNGTHIFFK